ncbi:MAG: helix-turn-helix domain-containing protein [Planctomycetota bacterium]
MSSIPMASGSNFADLRIVGCSESLQEPASTTREDVSFSPPHRQEAPPSQAPLKSTSSDGKLPDDATLDSTDSVSAPEPATTPYHRIKQVREQQGVSVRSMARRLGIDIRSYKRMECPTSDLSLSELHRVQSALDVPLTDLLIERDGLSSPVEDRAKLVKSMKTAVAIREAKGGPRIRRLAEMLCNQLVDIMPELQDVSGWPQFGARRGKSALGKALSQPIDMSQIRAD